MAHEVESMMYVGQTPWHGLGTKMEVAPATVEEALKTAGLDWTVRLEKLYLSAPSGALGTQVKDRFAVVRETDESVLGTVGRQWRPLQNKTAFAPLQEFLTAGVASIETAGSLRGGARVWMLLKIAREDSVIVPAADDRVAKYLLVGQGHDGTLAIHFGLTPVRVVCHNTLSCAVAAGKGEGSEMIRLRHTKSAADGLAHAVDVINAADRRFEQAAEAFRAMAKRPITGAELRAYVDAVFPQRKKAIEVAREIVAANAPLADLLQKPSRAAATTMSERGEMTAEMANRVYDEIAELFEGKGIGSTQVGSRGTAWGAYNAVTEFLSHRRGRSQDARVDNLMFGDVSAKAAAAAFQQFLSN